MVTIDELKPKKGDQAMAMGRLSWSLLISCLSWCPWSNAQDSIPPEQFRVSDGLEVTVWAKSPLLRNPTNIDIDSEGRIWVAEAVDYRGFQPHKAQSLWDSKGDRIVRLEDTDGDGQADQTIVFVQEPDLVAPLGLAVLGHRVFVSCSPHLLLYTDLDQDGHFDPKVDRKEKFLTGFGGFDHDHGLHALVAGPDGWFYFNAGNAGPHMVTDRSGWTLRAGSSYTGGTPYNTRNTPGLKSDDGRIYVGGLAMRIRPDGTGLSVSAHNFRNNYEICLDSFGNMFQNDNDDQVVTCRTTWLMEHANAGYASADGQRTWQADRRPGQSTATAHWHQDDPGVLPYGDLYGAGSPTGMTSYEGELLKDYRGMLLSCEAGRNVVWGYFPKPDGAGMRLDRFPLLASVPVDDPNYEWSKREKEPRKWFRPSDVATGPDGAVYVADWFDPVVGGHAMDDRRGYGTIYRIAPVGTKGRKLPMPALDLDSLEGQTLALRSSAVNVRFLGFEKLRSQGAKAMPAVERLLSDPDPFFRARGIWLMAQLGANGQARVEKLLGSADAGIRLVAFRALKQTDSPLLDHAAALAEDPDPAVRREVALAMRDLSLKESEPILLQLAARFDGQDRFYLEALGTGGDGKEDALYPALLGRLGALPLQWDERFAGLIWRLHPRNAITPLVLRVKSAELDHGARKQALDTLAFIKDRRAARAMADLAANGPADLRDDASWWVSFRRNNDWQPYSDDLSGIHVSGDIVLPGKPVYASKVIRKGDIVDINVEITGANKLYLVVTDAGDDIGCDWADWMEPRLITSDGQDIKLTSLKWVKATIGWGELNIDKNVRGLPLRVDGRLVPFGIGTHAESVIVYDIAGRKFARFVARGGLDNGRADLGGTDHPPGHPSVVFQVYHDGPTPEQRAVALQKVMLDSNAAQADRQKAALTLARSGVGGRQLLALAAQDKLPSALKPLIAETIHQNPDQMVRILAGQQFPLSTIDGQSLPSIAELAKLSGDTARGRALFHERAGCATCHTVAGQGGSIGPDLTGIGQKFDGPALLDSMLNPSASITFGYEATVLTQTDGEAITGFVVGTGDPVLIKDIATGQQLAIPAKKIASQDPLKTSVMPPVAALGLSAQELADLMEYLMSIPLPTR